MGPPEFVLALDLGTTCFKAALIDRAGEIRGLGRVTVEKDTEGRRCELPVERLRQHLRMALDCALGEAGVDVQAIRAISYSSQANSFFLLDHSEQPLTPLILWPDRRSEELPADTWFQNFWKESDFLPRTGLGVNGSEFCLAKLEWFQKRRPEIWARCGWIQSVSDYLVFSLTGRHCGDQATAALLGLLDTSRGIWWSKALEAARIRPEQLSEPLPPGTRAGTTSEGAKAFLGLPVGIPLVVGTLDHHAAALGAGIRSADVPCVSIGTVLACLRYDTSFSPLTGCVYGPGTHEYSFYLLAFENNGTGVLDRYLQKRHPDLSIDRALALADDAAIGCNGLMAYCDDRSESIFNEDPLSRSPGEVLRSLMECTGAGLPALIRRLYPERLPKRVVATGGGTRSDSWLRLFADLSGIEFAVPRHGESACLGAGMLAAVAAGWFSGLEEATLAWSFQSRLVRPDPRRHAAYSRWGEEYRSWMRQAPAESSKEEK